jgi:hypothetical protein
MNGPLFKESFSSLKSHQNDFFIVKIGLAARIYFYSALPSENPLILQMFSLPLVNRQILGFFFEICYLSSGSALGVLNTPGRIRTCDLRFRKPALYPTELRALEF